MGTVGTCRGITPGPFLFLLIHLLTHLGQTCGRSVGESSTLPTRGKSDGPSSSPPTQGILVEEIILAGGVNNSGIPGSRIIRDPGRTKERVLSLLVDRNETVVAGRQSRRTPDVDQAGAQSQTLIINVADTKDLENLEHILAVADYEPRKIDAKKVKRKTPQDDNDSLGSALEGVEITTHKSTELHSELAEKSRTRNPLNSRSASYPARIKSESIDYAVPEEGKDRSTSRPVTTQRVKRKLKKVDRQGSSENPLRVYLPDSSESGKNILKSSSEETKGARTTILRDPSKFNAALLESSAEPTALASSSIYSKSQNEGKESEERSFVAEPTKKKRKRKKTGQYEDSEEMTSKAKQADQTVNTLDRNDKNAKITENLRLLSRYDMIPRPFGFSGKQQENSAQSASENAQSKINGPMRESNVEFIKIPQPSAVENSATTSHPGNTVSPGRRSFHSTRNPVEGNSEVIKSDFGATDHSTQKIDPMAAFVNELTSLTYGNHAKMTMAPDAAQDESTAIFDIYKKVPRKASADLAEPVPAANARIPLKQSYVEFNRQMTSEPSVVSKEISPRIYKKIAASGSNSKRRSTQDLNEDVSTSANPETYEDSSETTISAVRRKPGKGEKEKFSGRLENYKNVARSLGPVTESYVNPDFATVPSETSDANFSGTYGTRSSLLSDPYVNTKSYGPASVTSDDSSENPRLSGPANVRQVDSNELRSKAEARRKVAESAENSDERDGSESSEETVQARTDYEGEEENQRVESSGRTAYRVHENPEEDRGDKGNLRRAGTGGEEENVNDVKKGKTYRVMKDIREKYGGDQKQDHSNAHREERNHEYVDQKQDHSQEHEQHDKGHKDDKQRDEKFEKGGGAEHEENHHSSEGSKGEKAYESEHDHEKKEKGHHDKERHSKHYGEEDGEEKKHHEAGGYHKEHHHEEKGQKAATFGEKGEHKKGHSTKGAHVVHKKDEFEKKTEFFDEFHEDGDVDKHGEFHHEHENEKGGHEKFQHLEAGEHEEKHGKKGEHAKGGSHHEHVGHKVDEGNDHHYDNEKKHGKKAGEENGKKWAFIKKGDDGGGEKKGDD